MAKAKSNGRSSRSNNKSSESSNGSMLEEFFMDALKDIYWAEKALTKALPRMSKAATSSQLKKAFDQHLEVTKKQIGRLDQVFEKLGKRAQGKKCDAMEGLVKESESIISETEDDTMTRDAALIMAAQKVEHYEIASYGGIIQLAKTMNKKGIAKLLESTLKEEKRADELLTKVAEKSINVPASKEAKKPKKGLMEIFS
jgi:ferritin-like metal-binding protein YciE